MIIGSLPNFRVTGWDGADLLGRRLVARASVWSAVPRGTAFGVAKGGSMRVHRQRRGPYSGKAPARAGAVQTRARLLIPHSEATGVLRRSSVKSLVILSTFRGLP
jgi:hypothetical protein